MAGYLGVLCCDPSRLKRSHSTSLDLEETETEFRRGGVRATAGPRLGWSRDLQHSAKYVKLTSYTQRDSLVSVSRNVEEGIRSLLELSLQYHSFRILWCRRSKW